MLFGDFEEDFAPKVAMGKDGIMTIISKYIHRLMVLKSEITHRPSCWNAFQANALLVWSRNLTLKLEIFFVTNPGKYSHILR